jgi:hypothetical protein
MTAEPANDGSSATADVKTDADARADRAWSLRVYSLVVASFVLWVVVLLILQRTFS